MFMVNLVSFAWTAAPAALVNSGLKYMQVRNIWTSTRAGKKSVGSFFFLICSLLCSIFCVHIE